MDDPAGKQATTPSVRNLGRDRRSRWVAILTGALSILIGLLYLLVVSVLDRSGPLLPPPPEALAEAVSLAPRVSLPESGAPASPPSGSETARSGSPVGVAAAGPAV